MAAVRPRHEDFPFAIVFLLLLGAGSAQFNFGSSMLGPCNVADNPTCERVGDIVLGGLFPVHKAEKDEQGDLQCDDTSRTLNEFGFERVEAMRFAVQKANDEKFLGKIKVGFDMRDTCQDSNYALRQSLGFLNIEAFNKPDYSFTVGVAGAASSGISIAVTDLLNLFEVPLVSYASTSAKLSDVSRYPSFFRTLPPDLFQARAMADIVHRLGWRYVHTVASTGAYGEDGIRSFIQAAGDLQIDVGARIELSKETKPEEVRRVIEKQLNNLTTDDPFRRGNLLVMFAHLDVAKNVMDAIEKTEGLKNRKFTFIGSDAWGDKVEAVYDPDENINSIEVARGLLSVVPEAVKVRELEEHVASLNPTSYSKEENPWFSQYWEKRFKCNPETGSYNVSASVCSNNTLANIELDSKVAYVVDAVFVFLHALKNMMIDRCGEIEMCSNATQCFNETQFCGNELNEYIRKVDFTAESGDPFRFDSSGDFIGAKYDVKNLHVIVGEMPPNNINFEDVGTWQLDNLTSGTGDLSLASEKLQWITGESGEQNAPVASCSTECHTGQYKARLKLHGNTPAFTCWRCEDCRGDHMYVSYAIDTYGRCVRCPANSSNSADRTDCIVLEEQYLAHDDGLAIFLMILAVIGVALVALTFAAFFAKWGTPVIMASSRELSMVLLSGILLCFVLTFVFIGRPSDAVCGIQRFCPVVFLSMIFGALLIKTNRISRLFNRGANVQRPPFISPMSQLVFSAIIVIISCVIGAVWLLIAPPEAVTRTETENVKVVRICEHLVNPGLLVSWVWIFFLIIACTYYGFKTRKIPENFRETMFISFAAYSECIIWLAFIPFGFVGLDDQYVTAIVSLAVMLSALAAWGCLFVPKVYIVILRPERNKRQTTMRRRSSHPSLGDTVTPGSTQQGSSEGQENGEAAKTRPTRLNSVHFINAV